jgi:deoxycytidine triphosphate deaminase
MDEESPQEVELLSKAGAKVLALEFREKADPFDDVKPSLLSAEHIEKYVLATGLVSPFVKGGEKSRLKKASYEGRVGKCAFIYDDQNRRIPLLHNDTDPLLVPANSIVFVECDLDFRLPRYIALRFNLQIRHVHRGLLLGTGPLIDPGYWGKLCIPLHNLTNADYSIPRKEGLIWVEFTKTTSDSPSEGRNPLEANAVSTDQGFWDITKFLEKSAQPFDRSLPSVGIRSSIAGVVEQAAKEAKEALDAANTARNSADSSAKTVTRLGFGAGAVAFGGFVGLWATFYFGVDDRIDNITGRVDQLQQTFFSSDKIKNSAEQIDKLTNSFNSLDAQLKVMKKENELLRERIAANEKSQN